MRNGLIVLSRVHDVDWYGEPSRQSLGSAKIGEIKAEEDKTQKIITFFAKAKGEPAGIHTLPGCDCVFEE